MKRINFTKLTIKNFLSVGNEEVKVKFKDGLNIITGYNRDEEDIKNGVGKSSVIFSFYFAIFGEAMVDLPNKFLINRRIGKGAVVRLEFEDISSKRGEEYFVIERTLCPNKCRIWKNDVEKTKSSIAETNKYILEVLDADEEIFKNCIVMRANSGASFMTKKKTEKKNFIESIFNLGVFSEMAKLLKDDIKEVRSKFDIENSALSVMESNAIRYRERIAEIQKQIDEQQQKIEAEKKRIEKAIKEEEEKILAMQSKTSDFDSSVLKEQQEKLNKANLFDKQLSQKLGELSYELKALKKQITNIDKIGNACPTCKRDYPSDMVNENERIKLELTQKVTEVFSVYKETEAKQLKLSEMRKTIQKIIDEQKRLENDIKVNNVRIASAKRSINQLQEMMNKVEEKYAVSPIDAFVQTLAETEEQSKEKKGIVDEIQKQLGRMNICEHIFGEQGVRSYIVNMLLELLNGRIKYYLKSFKSTFEFTFNEVFEEVITDANGVICMYNNCSGAEMKKIDLAIAFSFLDIIKFHRQVEYNVAFYDEILDSSVDNKSLEHIIEFIADRAKQQNKAVYIVTHKADIMMPQLTETVLLEKKNGFTRRIDG